MQNLNFFKGFLLTKNKIATKKWTHTNLLDWNQVQQAEEVAGVLANNVICLDCDDDTNANILLNIVKDLKIKTTVIKTTRGLHFYFLSRYKKNRVGTYLACGVKCDIRSGNSNSYCIVKWAGQEREVIYNNNCGDLPYFLNPVDIKINFQNMKKGDGRNSTLFSYKQYLARLNFTDEQIKNTITIINRYILLEPLPASELRTVNRPENFEPLRQKNTGFKFNEFADELIEVEKIKKIEGVLHIYDDGIYTPNILKIQKKMLMRKSDLKDQQRREVLKYLEIMAEDVKKINYNYIACNNGVYNLDTGNLQEFNSDLIITNKIPVDYNPTSASCELMNKTLLQYSCNNMEIYQLILEMVGYCLYRRNELGKCFILLGDKQNGKSTLLKVISSLVGSNNISSLDMASLGMRFITSQLHNKLVNIGDDIADEFIKGDTMAIFKKIVTGEKITAEYKGRDPFQFEPFCKLLFSANVLPKLKDFTEAGTRRIVIIPLRAKFEPQSSEFNPYIIDDLTKKQELEWLLLYSLNALQTVLKNKKFSEGEQVSEELENYKRENNPVLEFLNEQNKKDVHGWEIKKAYLDYLTWTEENGITPLKKQNFIKQICLTKNCKTKIMTINGLTGNRFYHD